MPAGHEQDPGNGRGREMNGMPKFPRIEGPEAQVLFIEFCLIPFYSFTSLLKSRKWSGSIEGWWPLPRASRPRTIFITPPVITRRQIRSFQPAEEEHDETQELLILSATGSSSSSSATSSAYIPQSNGEVQKSCQNVASSNGGLRNRLGTLFEANSANSSPYSNGETRTLNEDDFYEDDDDLLTLPSTSVFVGVPMTESSLMGSLHSRSTSVQPSRSNLFSHGNKSSKEKSKEKPPSTGRRNQQQRVNRAFDETMRNRIFFLFLKAVLKLVEFL
ncbi:hypothetical protein DdX_12534 [Ditylenchus destructor]|uniref:Uncharacterized protein n=1 Tax=Ditylenchus destructor TaxID=166010 RepID=A0AAD4MUW9_9BILA|nr:hypothetical protein DdX_12534 [Ditylenchus destructor]